MTKILNEGHARGAFGAAMKLANDGEITGHGKVESKARRVATRYLREREAKGH